jgi:hypothetical protein
MLDLSLLDDGRQTMDDDVIVGRLSSIVESWNAFATRRTQNGA